MELYFIRHGQSVGNMMRGYLAGRSDKKGLTPEGRAQITRTAWELHTTSFSQILTSPVTRAQESAQILSSLLDVPVTADDGFSEFSYGIFEGKYWWEVMRDHPDQMQNMREGFDTQYPEGESFKLLTERVLARLREVITQHQDEAPIMVVTHDAVVAIVAYIARFHDLSVAVDSLDGDHVMSHLHATSVPNAGYVKLTVNGLKVQAISTKNSFPPLSINAENLPFYLKGVQPDFSLQTISSLTTVSDNEVFLVKGAEQSLVLKVLSDKQIVSPNRLIKLYRFLEKKELPIPGVMWYESSNVFYTDPVIAHDYVSGEELGTYLEKNHDPGHVFERIYHCISCLHTIPVAEVHDFWFPNDWEEGAHLKWDYYMQMEIDKTVDHIPQMKLTEKIEMELRAALKRLRQYVASGHYTVVPLHGDLATENIIVTHEEGGCKLVRFLDFERARMGDRLWDLAYFYCRLEWIDKELALAWRAIFWSELHDSEQEAFGLFTLLYHAWTVRDTFDYTNKERGARGMKSKQLLQANLTQ